MNEPQDAFQDPQAHATGYPKLFKVLLLLYTVQYYNTQYYRVKLNSKPKFKNIAHSKRNHHTSNKVCAYVHTIHKHTQVSSCYEKTVAHTTRVGTELLNGMRCCAVVLLCCCFCFVGAFVIHITCHGPWTWTLTLPDSLSLSAFVTVPMSQRDIDAGKCASNRSKWKQIILQRMGSA